MIDIDADRFFFQRLFSGFGLRLHFGFFFLELFGEFQEIFFCLCSIEFCSVVFFLTLLFDGLKLCLKFCGFFYSLVVTVRVQYDRLTSGSRFRVSSRFMICCRRICRSAVRTGVHSSSIDPHRVLLC